MEEPAEGQEVEVTGGESRTEMLARHQKEIKELQHKEIGLKKAAAKGSKAEQKAKKKQAEEEVSRLDTKMKARHAKELASLGFRADEAADGSGLDGLVKAIAGISSGGKAAVQAGRPSKGQKWRDRRAHQDAERTQRIQEEQNNVVSQRKVEEEELERKLRPLGFSLKEIKSDGHCLYRAVEDQLALHPDVMPRHSYLGLRGLAAAYMRAHPDDFVPFIENSEVEGETVEERLEKYCSDVEATAVWGGQLELGALAHSLRKHIVVYSASLPDVEMGQEYGAEEPGHPVTPSIRLSYHRHAFGLGEHFNSVVPLPLPVPL